MLDLYRAIPGLVEKIKDDWNTNFRDWTEPGFRAVAVHRFGNLLMEAKPGLIRSVLWKIHDSMYRYVRNHYGIELPSKATIGRRLRIAHQSGIVIHPKAVIGDDCVIRQGVTIGAVNMDRIDDAPKLGHGVDVGAGAIIVGKITIGDGARIGPNAVVTTNVPAGATVFVEAPRIIQLQKARKDPKAENRGSLEKV